jgi:hypothetical protein
MTLALRCRNHPLRPAFALAIVLSLASTVAAQEGPFKYGGTSVFRFMLGPNVFRLKPQEQMEKLEELPSRSLLVVLGDTQILEQLQSNRLRSFLSHGGAVLIATDQATGNCVRQVFGVHVTGSRLHALASADQYLQKYQSCPVVQKMAGHEELFQGVHTLVSNVPSSFEPEEMRRNRFLAFLADLTGRKIVARLPLTADREGNRWGRPLPFAYEYLWRLGAPDGPSGQALLLADQDVFIDGLVFQKENDNFVFMYNALTWLTESGKRDRVLFYNDGQLVTDFDVPLKWKWSPIPDLPNPVAIADHLLAGLEKENAFNRLLHRVLPHSILLRLLAVLVTLAILARWIYHVFFHRAGVETAVPVLVGGPALGQTRGMVEGRQHAVQTTGNFWEAAHELARHCFENHLPHQKPETVSTMDQCALTAAGPIWQNWSLGVRARRLWQLAYRSKPRPVSRREFVTLAAWSDQVQQALEDGRLRVTFPPVSDRRTPKA